jgi:hypothetical protein
MTKRDLKKELKSLYKPSSKEIGVIDVPPLNFVMLDGEGDPNTSPLFQQAMEVLYAVSYSIKFLVKGSEDYVVMPLEGLWWAEPMEVFSLDSKGVWKWTIMIAQPDHITPEIYAQAVEQTRRKKNPARLDLLRFESFHEGLAAQIMHIGPYAAEAPTIERLHTWIKEHGYDFVGKHHEVYMSDPRRAAPDKMQTVIRQPVRPRSG